MSVHFVPRKWLLAFDFAGGLHLLFFFGLEKNARLVTATCSCFNGRSRRREADVAGHEGRLLHQRRRPVLLDPALVLCVLTTVAVTLWY
eukprot:3748021-Rhodomonas_salina.1